jgi:cysteine desulfurase
MPPTQKPICYFDNAATTPVFEEVVELMADVLRNTYGNPSSLHEPGRKAKVEIELARRKIAGLFNARPSEIFFTGSGTEANNIALWGCYKDLGRKTFITSKLEHPSVLKPLEMLQNLLGCKVLYVNYDSKGVLDLEHLNVLLAENQNAVVSLMHANNEIGNLLPVKDVADLCKRHEALFQCDMVQTAGKFQIDFERLPVDFASFSAHKFHGPKGLGILFARSTNTITGLVAGGKQERQTRAGTENTPAIAGMAMALEMNHSNLEIYHQKTLELRSYILDKILTTLPQVIINGDYKGSTLHTILNVSLPSTVDASLVTARFDMSGICISAGSACSSGSSKPSKVLLALGTDEKSANIRISLSPFNTVEEADRLLHVLKDLIGIGY